MWSGKHAVREAQYAPGGILQNCYFLNFKYGFYANVGESNQSMLLNHVLNEVVYLRCLLQIYAPTFFKS